MARVDVTLNGKVYPIACDDGQEARVQECARMIDERMAEVRGAVRSATDNHLLVMVCLLFADELLDMRQQVADAQSQAAAAADRAEDAVRIAEEARASAAGLPGQLPLDGVPATGEAEAAAADALGRLATRVEALAARLERA